MKAFLLLILAALVAGEVSGGIQVGVPAAQQAGTPLPPAPQQNETGYLAFAVLAAVAVAVTAAAIRKYLRPSHNS